MKRIRCYGKNKSRLVETSATRHFFGDVSSCSSQESFVCITPKDANCKKNSKKSCEDRKETIKQGTSSKKCRISYADMSHDSNSLAEWKINFLKYKYRNSNSFDYENRSEVFDQKKVISVKQYSFNEDGTITCTLYDGSMCHLTKASVIVQRLTERSCQEYLGSSLQKRNEEMHTKLKFHNTAEIYDQKKVISVKNYTLKKDGSVWCILHDGSILQLLKATVNIPRLMQPQFASSLQKRNKVIKLKFHNSTKIKHEYSAKTEGNSSVLEIALNEGINNYQKEIQNIDNTLEEHNNKSKKISEGSEGLHISKQASDCSVERTQSSVENDDCTMLYFNVKEMKTENTDEVTGSDEGIFHDGSVCHLMKDTVNIPRLMQPRFASSLQKRNKVIKLKFHNSTKIKHEYSAKTEGNSSVLEIALNEGINNYQKEIQNIDNTLEEHNNKSKKISEGSEGLHISKQASDCSVERTQSSVENDDCTMLYFNVKEMKTENTDEVTGSDEGIFHDGSVCHLMKDTVNIPRLMQPRFASSLQKRNKVMNLKYHNSTKIKHEYSAETESNSSILEIALNEGINNYQKEMQNIDTLEEHNNKLKKISEGSEDLHISKQASDSSVESDDCAILPYAKEIKMENTDEVTGSNEGMLIRVTDGLFQCSKIMVDNRFSKTEPILQNDLAAPFQNKRIQNSETVFQAILKLSSSGKVISFNEAYDWSCYTATRVGQSSCAEIFKLSSEQSSVILKIIVVESDKRKLLSLLAEVKIFKCLSSLRNESPNHCMNFCELKRVEMVKGYFPPLLKNAWMSDSSDSYVFDPSTFDATQMYLIFEMEDEGSCLSENMPQTQKEALSVMLQLGLALAIAEERFLFEHRDLHTDNILIKRTNDCLAVYCYRGVPIVVDTLGWKVTIIDFSLSKIVLNGTSYFHNLSSTDIFEQQGEAQYELYRRMKEELNNKWDKTLLRTNTYWLRLISRELHSHLEHKKVEDNSKMSMGVTDLECEHHAVLLKYIMAVEKSLSGKEFIRLCIDSTHKLYNVIFGPREQAEGGKPVCIYID